MMNAERACMKTTATAFALCVLLAAPTTMQRAEPDWPAIDAETLRHFQALLKFDTSDPPGNEQAAADYLKEVLEREGIPVEIFALQGHRPNVVARLKGNGSRRPLLLMGHTDVVNVDPGKWTHPPFGAVRDGGYIYARGTLDDKDNLTASLMVLLILKRLNVPLARDVIFLAEAGEEGSTQFGIEHVVNQQFPAIEAEYCLAEGGSVRREGAQLQFAGVQTTEKIPRRIDLTATGVAGHASMPLESNALVHLASAIEKVARWEAPIRLNETTATYFQRLAEISPPADAARYRDVLVSARMARGRSLFSEGRAAAFRPASHDRHPDHRGRRLSHQRHSVRSEGLDRCADAARRRPGGDSGPRADGDRRSGRESRVGSAQRASGRCIPAGLRRVQGDRGRGREAIRHRDDPDDGHGRH